MKPREGALKHHILRADNVPEFYAQGILCTLMPYRIAWEINRLSGLGLTRREDFEFRLNGKPGYHALFSAYDEDLESEVILLKNKGTSGILLPMYKQLDYLLLEAKGQGTYLTKMFDMRQSKFVQYCSDIKPDPIWVNELGIFEI